MNKYFLATLAHIESIKSGELALQARMQAMLATNNLRITNNESPAYGEEAFEEIAQLACQGGMELKEIKEANEEMNREES